MIICHCSNTCYHYICYRSNCSNTCSISSNLIIYVLPFKDLFDNSKITVFYCSNTSNACYRYVCYRSNTCLILTIFGLMWPNIARVRTRLNLSFLLSSHHQIIVNRHDISQHQVHQTEAGSPERGRDREMRSYMPWEGLYEHEGKFGLGERGTFGPEAWVIEEASSEMCPGVPSQLQVATHRTIWEREGKIISHSQRPHHQRRHPQRPQWYPGRPNGYRSPDGHRSTIRLWCYRLWWAFRYAGGRSLECRQWY